MPDADEGRFRIALNDTVLDIVLGDSGSYFSVITKSTMDKVVKATPSLPVKSLQKPITVVCQFKTDKHDKFSPSQSVALTVTINLPGSNIPVRVCGVEFFVVDQPWMSHYLAVLSSRPSGSTSSTISFEFAKRSTTST